MWPTPPAFVATFRGRPIDTSDREPQMDAYPLPPPQPGRLGLEVLTRLRTSVVVIDGECRVQHATPLAVSLLAGGRPASLSNGVLLCRRASDDQALRQALHRLLSSDDGDPSCTLFVRARASAIDIGLGLYVEALRPEPSGFFGGQPLAIVMIHDPQDRLKLDPHLVATAFGLTPAEAKVAVAVAEGLSAERIAARHRTSIHTVRSQVQTVLQKTGTTRQAEMVGMLAGLPAAARDAAVQRPASFRRGVLA